MSDHWSHEETDDPLYADRRNFYKVEKWSRDGQRIAPERHLAPTQSRRVTPMPRRDFHFAGLGISPPLLPDSNSLANFQISY